MCIIEFLMAGGYAVFPNLKITVPGQRYFLIFYSSASAFVISQFFDLRAGPPSSLSLLVQPESYRISGDNELWTMPVQPELLLSDTFGNTAQLASGGYINVSACLNASRKTCDSFLYQFLEGTKVLNLNSSQSFVSFTDLKFLKSGIYLLFFEFHTSTVLNKEPQKLAVLSNSFQVYPGDLHSMNLINSCAQNLTCGTAGLPLSTQPVVFLKDKYGNLVDDDNLYISVSIPGFLIQNSSLEVGNAVSSILTGKTTIQARNGIVVFTDLHITRVSENNMYFLDPPIDLGRAA